MGDRRTLGVLMGSIFRALVRRVTFLLVALSALACLGLSLLWWQSYRPGHRVTVEKSDRLYEARSAGGRVVCYVIRNWPGEAANGFIYVINGNTERGRWSFGGVETFEADLVFSQRHEAYVFEGWDVLRGGGISFPENPPSARVVSLPYPYPVVVAGLPFSIWLLVTALRAPAKVRLARRRRRGECVRCGYDLRFSRGRCPECGDPIPPRAAA